MKNKQQNTMKDLVKRLRKHRTQLATVRDALRTLHEEVEAQDENCADALEGLDNCISTLSEYV